MRESRICAQAMAVARHHQVRAGCRKSIQQGFPQTLAPGSVLDRHHAYLMTRPCQCASQPNVISVGSLGIALMEHRDAQFLAPRSARASRLGFKNVFSQERITASGELKCDTRSSGDLLLRVEP